MEDMGVMVVIPARDEAGTVGDVVVGACRHGARVLVVDDASADDTARRAAAVGAEILRLPDGGGYSGAVRAGFAQALEWGCDVVVTLDADGAHDPAEIPVLLDTHRKGENDLTIGDRFGPWACDPVPSVKRCANAFAAKLVNLAAGTSLDDVACGFRAMSRRLVERIVAHDRSSGYGLIYAMIVEAKRMSLRLGPSPVSVHYDAGRVLCTRRSEILDLLGALHDQVAADGCLRAGLAALRAEVCALRPVSVKLDGATFCLHPLSTEDAYLFQLQDGIYASQTVGRMIELDGERGAGR